MGAQVEHPVTVKARIKLYMTVVGRRDGASAEHTVQFKGRMGPRILNVLDRAINRRFEGVDWDRWELLDLLED